jgi:hypothetical protein
VFLLRAVPPNLERIEGCPSKFKLISDCQQESGEISPVEETLLLSLDHSYDSMLYQWWLLPRR